MNVFKSLKNRIGDSTYNSFVSKWLPENPLFAVNQKTRNWSGGNKTLFENLNSVNPYILQDMTGIDTDPTKVLLSSDFLKELNYSLFPEFVVVRDYIFNSIIRRLRGFRTNSKNRFVPGTDKKNRIFKKETQLGVTDFDFEDLNLNSHPYYTTQAFLHPARSQCKTTPLLGMYSNEAEKRNIPIACGISGSTNFWLWTALFSGVNMTLEEIRLYILSAFITLNADGGHILMEVLSSAAMCAILWKDYIKYSKDRTLEPYINGSTFAAHLYEITKNINPIGNAEIIPIDKNKVVDDIFNKGETVYNRTDDSQVNLSNEEKHLRLTLESYILNDNARYNIPFGEYTTFLDQIPPISEIRKTVINRLSEYETSYC